MDNNQKNESELYWEEGQLLYPAHFESLTGHLRHHIDIKTSLIPFGWGINKVEAEIIGNTLHVKDFDVVMADGILLNKENSSIEKNLQFTGSGY